MVSTDEKKSFAYVTLLTTDHYLPGVLALYESILRVKTGYPLWVVVGPDVSDRTRAQLSSRQIPCIRAEHAVLVKGTYRARNEARGAPHWTATFDKLQVFALCQFEKIVYLDSDMIVLANLDHLFAKPHMSAVVAGARYPGNEGWADLNTGLMVIEPNPGLLPELLSLIPEAARRKGALGVSDQDVIQQRFPDWSRNPALRLPERYNLFTEYLDHYIKHLGYAWAGEEGIHVLHFVGPIKPWMLSPTEILRFHVRTLRRRSWHEYAASAIFAMMLYRANRRMRPTT